MSRRTTHSVDEDKTEIPPTPASFSEDKTDPYPPPMQPVQPELSLEGLRRGDSRIAVSILQTRLGVPATGTYDETTEHVVRRFQRDQGLNADGVATPRVHGILGLPWPPLDS